METQKEYKVNSTTPANVAVGCPGCGAILGHYVDVNGAPQIAVHGSPFVFETLRGVCKNKLPGGRVCNTKFDHDRPTVSYDRLMERIANRV